MASFEKVEQVLRLMALNFAGEVSPERAKLWYAALKDIPDPALDQGAAKVLRERTGDFLPPVAVIRDACAPTRSHDSEAILRAIDKAGSYNPQTGWQAPRIETIREQFGAGVATAYGMAGGGSRLFASDERTRDIAAREFAAALRDAPSDLDLLPAHAQPKALPHG